ncbi:MAG: c-type cytochrome [Thermodesulfovibrionia bacterium]|nr:c-type cytochrome [Thermodesulfovibrionia bacterium]
MKIGKVINKKTCNIIFSIMLFSALLPMNIYAQDEEGKALYDGYCARCHGFNGDGKGDASNFTFPKPRDFTSGIYKFRSTPTGEPPVDDDLKRITLRGIPGTSMTGWEGKFNSDELQALVDYVKGFSEETFEFPGEPFEIGEPPPETQELLNQGKEIFEKAKCWECHGKFGRGDGEKGWQEGFKDDWGEKIYPTNLAHPWELRHGAGLKDLFRTVTAGFDGTPMASFQDAYSDEERWALSYYLKSIQITRKFDTVLKAHKVSTIPTSTEDTLWDEAGYIDIKMEGEKVFGFPFIAMITNTRVRALYSDSEVAIMLEWADKKPNKSDDGFPPDAVQLQFSIEIQSRSIRPFSPGSNLINIWHWNSSDNSAVEFEASGLKKASMTRQEKSSVKAASHYSDGLYRVIFKRRINTKEKNVVTFPTGTHIPFSVVAYDGQNYEEEARGALSAVRYIILR